MNTKHYTNDRIERENLIRQIGIGEEVATFRVDRGHPNGAELHTITTTAIIIIRNERTNKIVTKLIARPGQIDRYFNEKTAEVLKLRAIAREHQLKRYNEM